MKLSDALPWAGWVACVLLLGVSALLYAENREAVGEARQADRAATEARERAEAARQRADRARDSLEASRERERAYRARLDSVLEDLAAEASEASEDVDVRTVALDSTLAALRRRVPDELVGLVTRAESQTDSLSRAHLRFREAMRERVSLLTDRSASLQRQLTRTDRTLEAVEDELASVREALAATREARDRWRTAADPSLIRQLLGRSLLEGAATVGSGIAAWAYSWKSGVGWTGGQVARVAF